MVRKLGSTLSASVLLAGALVGLGAGNASAQPFRCVAEGGVIENNSSGVFRTNKDLNLRAGPYSDCDDIGIVRDGAKVFVWCAFTNGAGNKWLLVRPDGSTKKGWVFTGNLERVSGSVNFCPLF